MEYAKPRALDHLVLPTRDLKIARSRLEELGFTVAPEGQHPFGTSNCCVFLSDGTYLEPLAATDLDKVEDAIEASNVFVSHFSAYRFRRGDEGFSGIAFATDDAEGEDKRFRAAGMSAGQPLEFSRDLVGPDGGRSTATFRLAFARDERAPDFLAFAVQRINFPKTDRRAQETHANGVVGIRRILLGAPQAAFFVRFLAGVANAGPSSLAGIDTGLASLKINDLYIDLMDNTVVESEFDVPSNDDRGLQARGVVFGVTSLSQTEVLFAGNGIGFAKRGNRIVVPPETGQGAIFVFESFE